MNFFKGSLFIVRVHSTLASEPASPHVLPPRSISVYSVKDIIYLTILASSRVIAPDNFVIYAP